MVSIKLSNFLADAVSCLGTDRQSRSNSIPRIYIRIVVKLIKIFIVLILIRLFNLPPNPCVSKD